MPQAQVASSKDVADQISGSLVDAKNLSNNLGLVLSIVAAAAAFLLAALLALSSVGKRIRELGTLKALGWTQRMVVRQIAGESLAQGILGGVLGIGLGIVAALAVDAFGPTLTASSTLERRHDLRRQRRRGPHRDEQGVARRADRVQDHPARIRARAPRRPRRRHGRSLARRAPPPGRRAQAGRLMDALYDVRGVEKFFQRGPTTVRALDGVALEIGAGEFVALEGPSGSGKTTLLQLLGALDRPSGGEVLFEGSDLAKLPDRELARLRLRSFGFVFQQFNLIPTLTAVENVEAKLIPAGGTRERALELLGEVGLAERSDHLPHQLSGGEQQRVAIARALSVEPRVVLADEPTGNLDTETGREIIDLLAGLAAEHGSTVIVATHDATLASRSPRRLRLRDGRLVGPPVLAPSA